MSLRVPVARLPARDYLEREKTADVKHEYLDGIIYAMSGASRRHNLLSLNLATALRAGFSRTGCQTFVADVKVLIAPLNYYYYPDIVVTCDSRDDDDYVVTRPVVIVEVASPTTAPIDRREKLIAYRRLETLREYVLVAQDEKSVEVFHLDQSGEWWSEELGEDDELCLESIDLKIPVSQIYDTVGL
jgi:Uma2 family endonuclease